MSKTLAELVSEKEMELSGLQEQVTAIKQEINLLSRYDGLDEPYPDAVGTTSHARVSAKAIKIIPDQFTNKPPGKAARIYLELRNAADPENRAATLEEIRDGLLAGGYSFGTKDPIQALGISLGKTTATFKRVGDNGLWGLTAWYGIKPGRSKLNNGSAADIEEEDIGGDEEDGLEAPVALIPNPNCNGDDGEPAKLEMNP